MVRRLLKEESGFTLPEILVTMLIMLTVMFALYSIFDMSIRVFGFGNDKVESAGNARVGLERMARELRAAYPVNNVDTDPSITDNRKKNLFWTAGSPATGEMPVQGGDQVTFGNDRNGNRRIYDTSTGTDAGEEITYSLSGGSLNRNGQPLAENVQDVDGDGKALTFTYLDANGNTATSGTSPAPDANIKIVRIKLEVSIDRNIGDKPGTQILQTDVALRNGSG